MQNNRESAFYNPRVLAALLLGSAGACLAIYTFASPLAPNDPPSCAAPGTLITSDPAGDQNGAPAANQQLDIQSISIAEPCFAGGVNKFVFTMKVANLSSLPANGHWKIRFLAAATTYFV